jgi:hypothetical protein
MSYLASGSIGVLAGALALGAVHLEGATGNDLLGSGRSPEAVIFQPAASPGDATSASVNRTAKADRELAVEPIGGITLSFRTPGVSDGSVMMRVPAGGAADALRKAPVTTTGSGKGSSAGKTAIACEPVVSVLTTVAKQLGPGRCIT